MYYFTSDTHFSDIKTLKNEGRPFKDVRQCDNFIIKTWNRRAKKSDTIFCVGDLLDCDGASSKTWEENAPKCIKRIKAKIVLIMGNNEERIVKYFFNNNFNEFKKWAQSIGIENVYRNKVLTYKENEYFLTHRPKDHKEGYINIFGHVHRYSGLTKSYGVNVSADINFFRLFSFEDINNIMEKSKTYDYANDPDINSWF